MRMTKMVIDKAYVANYYDATARYYERFWSRALHYGFWGAGIKNVHEAVLNENKFLAEIANIKRGDTVLDAGCGLGDSSIWLAHEIGAQVIGITISEKQREKAIQFAQESGVAGQVQYLIQDFCNTEFPDDYFDVVWAIESVCHAEKKIDFLKEAYWILKPRGGRLVVADGFLSREVLPKEDSLYKDFLEGLALVSLASFSEFGDDMRKIGFTNVPAINKTKEILPSSRKLYWRCLFALPFMKLVAFFGLVPDIVVKNGPAGIAQYKMVRSGLAGYGVFVGTK